MKGVKLIWKKFNDTSLICLFSLNNNTISIQFLIFVRNYSGNAQWLMLFILTSYTDTQEYSGLDFSKSEDLFITRYNWSTVHAIICILASGSTCNFVTWSWQSNIQILYLHMYIFMMYNLYSYSSTFMNVYVSILWLWCLFILILTPCTYKFTLGYMSKEQVCNWYIFDFIQWE